MIRMKVLVVILVVGVSKIKGDYPEEDAQETLMQSCYSCSSQSALCRDEVYDGTYLTKTPCKSKCFARREGRDIYRGCFDGWLGGLVKYNYDGCKTQTYLGKKVEWCFCSGSGDLNEKPCNALSFKSLGSNIPQESFGYNPASYQTNAGGFQGTSYQGIPIPDYKQYMKYGVSKTVVGKSSSSIEAKEGGSSPGYIVSKYKIECYECHDGFPYCAKHITRPDYVAVKGCKSQCFIRKERNNVYRGCFDGWLKTSVKHNYNGCSVQDVYGTKVEWCFCGTNLCNGRSMDDMGEIREISEDSGFDIADTYTYQSPSISVPAADEISTYKKIDAREGVDTGMNDNKFGVADVYDNNVYNYAPSGRVSPPTMCRGLPNGVYTDPFDCVMYINCLNGYTYRRRCPPGTAWNAEAGFCDYAHKVAHMCKPLNYVSENTQFDNQWIVEDDKNKDYEYTSSENSIDYGEDYNSSKSKSTES